MHTIQRIDAFRSAARELGLEAEVVETDYSAEMGARATRKLLSSPHVRRRAIVFDSDLLAVTGLGVAQQMGFTVPDDLSIVGLGRLPDQPGRPSAADGDHARHHGIRRIAATRHLLEAIDGRAAR